MSASTWDVRESNLYKTDYHTWNKEQMLTFLTKVERIPKEYAEHIVAGTSNGRELAQLSRVELHAYQIPWGICSHICKGLDNLRSYKHGIYAPSFVPSVPYSWPFDGNLRMDNTALIIIDMQKDFVGEGGYAATMYPEAFKLLQEPIGPIKALLNFCRPAGITIIHTREGHHPNMTDCPRNKRWRTAGVNSGIGDPSQGNSLVIGSERHDIIAELYPQPGEDVIDKPGKGSFYATNLEALLKNSMIDNLIITGVTTDVCVHTTLRDANDMGFECLLVEDACAAVSPTNQAAAIDMVHRSGGIFGATCKSEQLLKVLEEVHEREQKAKHHKSLTHLEIKK